MLRTFLLATFLMRCFSYIDILDVEENNSIPEDNFIRYSDDDYDEPIR